jgi:hypothetical protein
MDKLSKTDILTEEIKLAENLIQELLKAKKQMRMYPSNNPVYIKASETIYDKFKKFLGLYNRLLLKIHQYEIIYKNEQLYYNHEKDDNLALFLFKDGIRELAFLPGLAQQELEGLIGILNTDFEKDVLDDDVVTLLWEKDFKHIKYVVDENFLSDWEIPERKKIPDEAIKTAYEDALRAEKTRVKIPVDIYNTDPQYLAKEIEQQAQPKIEKIITILFELLYQTRESPEFTEIIRAIEATIDYCITKGALKNASYILDMIKAVTEDKIYEERIKELNTIHTVINSKEFIEKIGMVLDSETVIEEGDFIAYIKHLNASAIPFFMHLMGEKQDIRNRRLIIEALTTIGRLDIKALSKGLHDSRWYVVRNTALVMGKIATSECMRHLGEIIAHPDQRVRKETIKAIGNIKSPNAFGYLKNAFNDSVQSIRVTAARALGNIKTEDAKKLLLSELSRKDFFKKDFTEKKEFYEILTRWEDEDVKDFLIKTLNKKRLFRRTKNDEIRACAAYVLGIITAKNSIPSLKKASRSKNKLLRELSLAALKRLKNT